MSNSITLSDHRRIQFFPVYNDFFDRYASKMTPHVFMVYLGLCRRANHETDYCFPSRRHLADLLGISTKSVDRAFVELQKLHLIAVTKRTRSDGGDTSDGVTILEPPIDSESVVPDCESPPPPTVSPPPPDSQSPAPPTVSRASNKTNKNKTEINKSKASPSLSAKAEPKRPHKIPDDFLLTIGRREYAERKGLAAGRVDSVFERFTLYWHGNNKPKADWDATWRLWVLNEIERGAPNGSALATAPRRKLTDEEWDRL